MTREVPTGLVIRRRVDTDFPALTVLLEKQQAASEYPIVWPLPFGVDTFLKRPTEKHAWVAELDGEIVGHIAITTVDDMDNEAASHLTEMWIKGHGGAPKQHELRLIGVFFTDLDRSGSGIGHHLFDTAVRTALEEGYPVLDVVDTHPGPVNFYVKRGWKIVGRDAVPWDPVVQRYAYAMVLERTKQGAVDAMARGATVAS